MELNEQERAELLSTAREAITARLEGREPKIARPASARLTAIRAAFVCVKVNGRLRGCIGSLRATQPLWQTVRDMAGEAAFGDPRFAPLGRDELPGMTLELSVLSPMERTENPASIEVGRHGISI